MATKKKVTDLESLQELSNNDVIHIVDVSDTTEDPAGSSFKTTIQKIREFFSIDALLGHVSDIDNPHEVTKDQVGLGDVDNTSDEEKPISIATQEALDEKLEQSDIANFETTTQLNARDTANRSRSNHTGEQAISTVTNLQTTLDSKIPLTQKGANNGVATLDNGGKIPASQLPSTVMEFKGTWNANTNTPALANGTGDSGDVYLNIEAGTVNFGAGNISFEIGDWAVYGDGVWQKSINSNKVVSVNGQQGVVILDADDIDDTSTNKKFTNSSDISKLAGIESGAQVNTVNSVAGKTGVVTLDKTDVGLGNVDNTSDVNKPISSATQTALNAKYDASNPSNYISGISGLDHNSLGNLNVGDVHTQYALLTGRTGGQTLIGGNAVTDILTLQGTSGNGTAGSPAVQIKVGNNGATTALTVLNNGNVGIGTGTPQDKLDVFGDGAGITVRSSTANLSDSANIRLLEITNAGIRLQYDGVGPAGSLGALLIKDNGTDAVIASFLREGMVGIGTTAPQNKLEISETNSGNDSVLMMLTNRAAGTATGTGASIGFQLSTTVGFTTGKISNYNNGTNDRGLSFSTYGGSLSEQMRITGGGNVGIGTTTPTEKLVVVGNITTSGRIFVSNGTAASPSFTFSDDTDTGIFRSGTNALQLVIGGNRAINFNSSGAQMNGGALSNVGQFIINSAGNAVVPDFRWNTSGQRTGFYSPTLDNLGIVTNSNERIRITDTGNVGIGSTAPSSKLHIIGTTEQFRAGYDVSNYFNATVGSTGTTTFNAVGSGAKFVFSDPLEATTIKATSAGGFISSDNSAGVSGSWTTTDGKTITAKDGIITAIV